MADVLVSINPYKAIPLLYELPLRRRAAVDHHPGQDSDDSDDETVVGQPVRAGRSFQIFRCRLVGCLVGSPVGRLVRSSVGWLVVWLVRRSVGEFVLPSVGWLVRPSVSWSVGLSTRGAGGEGGNEVELVHLKRRFESRAPAARLFRPFH